MGESPASSVPSELDLKTGLEIARDASTEVESSPMLLPLPPPSPPADVLPDTNTANGIPAGFLDISSIVPDTQVLFPATCPPIGTDSTAKATRKFKGIYSHDPILDQNPDELWRFLVSNLENPHIFVHLRGTHTETRTQTKTGSEGSTSTETYTETITDFSMNVDVSSYVLPQWSRMVTRPSRKASNGTETATVRETLVEYTRSKNPFKEFRLSKQVLWDYNRLREMLVGLVRSTGYRTHVGVTFPKEDYKVVALASNKFSRAAHSKAVRVLCVLTCLCIVFWPAWAISRKRIQNRLSCEYSMAFGVDEFYTRNYERVRLAVLQRRKGLYMAAW